MKLVNQTFELVLILLGGVILEPNGLGFNAQQGVIVQSAALCLHAVCTGGQLLQQEIVVA